MQRLKKGYVKVLLSVAGVALVVTALLEGHNSYVRNLEARFYMEHMSEPQPAVSTCRLPDYDPFDPTIMKYVKSWRKIDCGNPQPQLTFVDKEGFLHINKSAVAHSKIYWDRLLCTHQEIKRRKNDDERVELGPKKVFFNPDVLHEFNVVRCIELESKKLLYETGYARVKDVPKNLAEKSRKAFQSGRSSILILVLDSMSRLNFMRQLPKTYKFIKEEMKGVVMKGLTKVGDNTYPNMITLLTGLASSRNYQDKSLAPFWGNATSAKGHFDHLPALWKNFSQHDYVTMFAEDHPRYAAFNYNAHGFKKPPTDYYMRPFWLAMEQQKRFTSKDQRCYGHVPKHKFLLSYMEDFLEKMQTGNHSYFAFTFFTLLSHDHINAIKIIDDELLASLKKLKRLGTFNNTAVLIMGDHGNRFDNIRSTVIGRVEERMPFLAISLPPLLEHFRPNLEQNSNRLTSWHDVYEMLMDVAENNTLETSRQLRYGYKGLSLFRPVPDNRTCLQIGIPTEYCICWVEKELSPKGEAAVAAGKKLVLLINKLLEERDRKKLCAVLVLDFVKNAQKLLPSHTVAKPDDLKVLTRVQIQVKPSGALLEATLEQKALIETKLVGNVNRLNAYGNQSSCVSEPALTLICYCKH